jgi:hypothetical protein
MIVLFCDKEGMVALRARSAGKEGVILEGYYAAPPGYRASAWRNDRVIVNV